MLVPFRRGKLVAPFLAGSVPYRDGRVPRREGRVPLAALGATASPPVPERSIQLVGLSGRFISFLLVLLATSLAALRTVSVLLSAPCQSAGLYRWDSQPTNAKVTQAIVKTEKLLKDIVCFGIVCFVMGRLKEKRFYICYRRREIDDPI